MAVRRMTNPFRRGNGGELAKTWRSLKLTASAVLVAKATCRPSLWLGAERQEGRTRQAGRPARRGDGRRSQSLHGTEARERHMPGHHKPGAGTGGRKVNA